MSDPKQNQFTIWRLMKGVAIAALITSAFTGASVPLIRRSEEILGNPGLFVTVLALVLLLKAPFMLLPNFIDWILGNKPSKPSN